jgi:hypothetical protein
VSKRSAPPEVDEFLAPFPEEVQEIVHLLRARVLKVVPNAHETVWDAINAVSLGYSPTTRWQDGIVHIATYSKHVNLGFNQGATVDDPLGIFEGNGSRIRHVTFRTPRDTKAKWIDDYLRRAMAAAGMSATDGDSGTTIRVMKGVKRRPK